MAIKQEFFVKFCDPHHRHSSVAYIVFTLCKSIKSIETSEFLYNAVFIVGDGFVRVIRPTHINSSRSFIVVNVCAVFCKAVIVKKFLAGALALIISAGALLGVSNVAYAQDLAGSVLIVIGEANISDANGITHAVTRGAKVYAGQSISTGANGHVNLRMVDGAAVIVRASSRLKIEEYFVDSVTPSKSRIKLNLESGVVRSITGKAGEASTESYRLNTPLAAIGIRGTDFVVQANRDVTRVQVQSGAIVMTPISDDCSRDTLGPCKSAKSRDLTAAMRDAYLELRSRSDAPSFVPAEKAIESPNLIAPPRQDEPKVVEKSNKAMATNVDTYAAEATRTVAADTIKTQVDVVASKPDTTKPDTPKTDPTTPSTSTTTPDNTKPVEPVIPQKIWWGRWDTYANAKDDGRTVKLLRSDAREVSSSNSVFGLLRETTDNVSLPSSGTISFKLADSESYLMNADKSLTAASIDSAKLNIDFNNRKYDTSLMVNAPGISPVQIQSQGKVTFQGYFISEANSPDTIFDGSLYRDGSQAGFIFQRFLSGGASVVGATRWTR